MKSLDQIITDTETSLDALKELRVQYRQQQQRKKIQSTFKPEEILAIESLRIGPFSGMFGVSEFEQAAQTICKALAVATNKWNGFFWLPNFVKAELLSHYDAGEFCPRYWSEGYLTQEFVDYVHRKNDTNEFREAVKRTLLNE